MVHGQRNIKSDQTVYTRATCPAHLIVFDAIILIIFTEECRSWISSLSSFIRPPVTCCFWGLKCSPQPPVLWPSECTHARCRRLVRNTVQSVELLRTVPVPWVWLYINTGRCGARLRVAEGGNFVHCAMSEHLRAEFFPECARPSLTLTPQRDRTSRKKSHSVAAANYQLLSEVKWNNRCSKSFRRRSAMFILSFYVCVLILNVDLITQLTLVYARGAANHVYVTFLAYSFFICYHF